MPDSVPVPTPDTAAGRRNALRLTSDERWMVGMTAVLVGVGWLLWITLGSHRGRWWFGTLVAVGMWALMSVAVIGNDRIERTAKRERLAKKLQTHKQCPTCGGEGWVSRA